MKRNIFRNTARYFVFFFVIIFLISGCGKSHQKEAKQEKEIIGFVEGYNPRIEEMQNCLGKAGFYHGQIDGKMGVQTRTAIKDFQKANNLTITGFIDSKTRAMLNTYQQVKVDGASKLKPQQESKKEASTKTVSSWEGKKEVQDELIKSRLKSSIGEKKIQRALKSAGFDPGPIDGKIGPKTKKAIAEFQKSRGLISNGIIDSKTQEELSKYFPKE